MINKKSKLKTTLSAFCALTTLLSVNIAQAKDDAQTLPNIVLILADDLGYGDIGAYNSESKIPTPRLDKLASEGMKFTDMHSPSAVCTPTRYSLLTGRYAWRTNLKSGVLWGYSPLMIDTKRTTIASLLKDQGYHTAGIGKWHLGLGNGEADYFAPEEVLNDGDTYFSRLSPGPNEVGFNYFFGIPASLDMKPYLFIENGTPTEFLDGTLTASSKHRRDNGGGFWRRGQIAKDFDFHQVLPLLTDKAVTYIDDRAKDADKPFFLYFAPTSPHTPWLPGEEFKGKSGAGYYGDFVAHTDHAVGQVLDALKRNKLDKNTLVIVTSDNGAHWLPDDIVNFEHKANGNLRGQKADIHEGGHRVPFLAKWPGVVEENTQTSSVVTLADVLATVADITDTKVTPSIGPDGASILPILNGSSSPAIEQRAVIHHALDGMFAIRRGNWKLIEGLGSGGFTTPMRIKAEGSGPNVQLYNLATDPLEKNNVATQHPKLVDSLLIELNSIRNNAS